MDIDLYAPGGLDALFARNHARYGGLIMMADPEDDPDDEDPDLDPEDDDPDEDLDADPAPYVAPDKAAWDKIQRKIQRQEERITRLLEGRGKAPAKKTASRRTPAGTETDPDKALLAQLRAEREEEETDDEESGEATRWRGIAASNAAATQLAAAGFNGTAKQAARLTRLLDLTGAEPDRHGAFDFEDEIEELVEEYPALFGQGQTGAARRPAPRVGGRGRETSTPRKDPSRSTSDALLKSAGYR